MLLIDPFSALINLSRLYGSGGIVIDDRPYLLTLIQPDADVVFRIATAFFELDPAARDALLLRHLARLRAVDISARRLGRTLELLRGYAWVPPAFAVAAGGPVLSIEWLVVVLLASGGIGAGARFARPLATRGGLALVRWTFRRTVRRRLGRPVN